MSANPVRISLESVVRLWFWQQGLSHPRGLQPLTRALFVDHLTRTGALQLDSVNVVDRVHYLTLWSRFGVYDRQQVDRWVYNDGVAYEYWGHEASILPIAHLPLGMRGMRNFPPRQWKKAAWWEERYAVSLASRRRVLRRLRQEGPLERIDFDTGARTQGTWGNAREDKRALHFFWHAGRVAICNRRHFRKVYDLAERVYPDITPVRTRDYEDSWLLIGLSGNGIASEKHLMHYWTGPAPHRELRKKIIARNLASGRIIELRVEGMQSPFYGLPDHLDVLPQVSDPRGTTLICPFDSLLWQRQRARDLLGFEYRIEMYTPGYKRLYGYYVLPILHNGQLVGRLDPKLHRSRRTLEIKNLYLEEDFRPGEVFMRELGGTLESLATFLGATAIHLPEKWRHLVG